MLKDEQPSPEQIAVLRAMSPGQRWRAAHQLYWMIRRHKTAFLQSQHPDWLNNGSKTKYAAFSSMPDPDLIP
jgi:hypothetical protein